MTLYRLGPLDAAPVSERPELLASPVLDAITGGGPQERTGVVEIDADISYAVASQQALGLPWDVFATCVIVSG